MGRAMDAFVRSLDERPTQTSAAETRHYWLVMQYGCEACGFEMDFYLEVGCEGPRERSIPVILPRDHPFRPGEQIEAPMTNSGRMVVPVPFVAGWCGDCGEDSMTHIRWNEDRYLHPLATTVPEDAGAFFYPSDPDEDGACGRPVYPKARPPRSGPTARDRRAEER